MTDVEIDPHPTTGGRPLRRDAELNRKRILEAASEVFAQGGLDVTMDDIATAAGIGMGTLYRRFRTKEALIDGLFEARIGLVVALAEEALAYEDAWRGLVFFLEQVQSLQATDRGLVNALFDHRDNDAQLGRCRRQLGPLGAELVGRAQAQGHLRPDVQSTDLPLILLMLSTVARYTNDVAPNTSARFLTLIIDGLRTQRRRPTPLAAAGLSVAQLEASIASWAPCDEQAPSSR